MTAFSLLPLPPAPQAARPPPPHGGVGVLANELVCSAALLPLLEVPQVPLKTSGPGLAHTKHQPPLPSREFLLITLLLLPQRPGRGGGAKTATAAGGGAFPPCKAQALCLPWQHDGVHFSAWGSHFPEFPSSLPLLFPCDISHPSRVCIPMMNLPPRAGKNARTLAGVPQGVAFSYGLIEDVLAQLGLQN